MGDYRRIATVGSGSEKSDSRPTEISFGDSGPTEFSFGDSGLNTNIRSHPFYRGILDRLKDQNDSYLDVGARFQKDIRQLQEDGAPTENCIGVDLESQLTNNRVKDQDELKALFFDGRVFETSKSLNATKWKDVQAAGGVNIIYASNIFHLFGLRKQRQIAELFSSLTKAAAGSCVVGMQLTSNEEPAETQIFDNGESMDGDSTGCHDKDSMQKLWDTAGEATGLSTQGLRWEVELASRDMSDNDHEEPLTDQTLSEGAWTARLILKT